MYRTQGFTYILVFLEEHQVFWKVLPDELFDDLLLNPRIQDIRHQAGISENIARTSRFL